MIVLFYLQYSSYCVAINNEVLLATLSNVVYVDLFLIKQQQQ